MWALTSIYAYRAYQDPLFLMSAMAIWDEVTVWTVTEEDAENGFHPLKDGTFTPNCNGSESWSFHIPQTLFMDSQSFLHQRSSARRCIQGEYMQYLLY